MFILFLYFSKEFLMWIPDISSHITHPFSGTCCAFIQAQLDQHTSILKYLWHLAIRLVEAVWGVFDCLLVPVLSQRRLFKSILTRFSICGRKIKSTNLLTCWNVNMFPYWHAIYCTACFTVNSPRKLERPNEKKSAHGCFIRVKKGRLGYGTYERNMSRSGQWGARLKQD